MREKHKNVEQEKVGQEAKVMGNKHTECLTVRLRDRSTKNQKKHAYLLLMKSPETPVLNAIIKVY